MTKYYNIVISETIHHIYRGVEVADFEEAREVAEALRVGNSPLLAEESKTVSCGIVSITDVDPPW